MTRDIIEEKTIEKVLNEFNNWFLKKLKQKGMGAFSSRKECIGHLDEEVLECKMESHARNDELLQDELLDVASSALWSICSLRTINKK